MLESDTCYRKKNQSRISVIGFMEEECNCKWGGQGRSNWEDDI